MISPRRKGKAGELEVAALLRSLLGTAVVRNLTQTRDGGHDLVGLPGWSAEVKRSAKPRIGEWWNQTVDQANGAKPVLLSRRPKALACGDRAGGRGLGLRRQGSGSGLDGGDGHRGIRHHREGGAMKDPNEYRLHLVDIGGHPHPDERLLMLLRTLREFGFILADCEGVQPPEPSTMEALAREQTYPFLASGAGRKNPRTTPGSLA